MTMNSDVHSRFLFDADFSRQANRDNNTITAGQSGPSISDEASYAKGFTDGQQDILLKNQEVTEEYFKSILTRINDVNHAASVRSALLEEKIMSSIIDLGLHFISKLDPIDVLEDPKLGILSIIEMLDRETQLALHVSEQDHRSIETALHRLGSGTPITLRADPAIRDGDFELIWSDGGIKFERETLHDRFQKIAKTYRLPAN